MNKTISYSEGLSALVEFFGNETPSIVEIGESTINFMVNKIKEIVETMPSLTKLADVAIKFLNQLL